MTTRRASRAVVVVGTAAALGGCASMVQTQSSTAAGPPERVVLDQKREPARDRRDVALRVEGNTVIATVSETIACVKHLGESQLTTVTTERRADKGVLTFEAIAAGVGAALIVYGIAASSPCNTREFCIDPGPIYAGLGGLIAVPAGIATIVDATAGGTSTDTHVVTKEIAEEDRTPCKDGPMADGMVTLVLDDGTVHEAKTGVDGVARIELADSVWTAASGPLGADLKLEGRLLRRVKLERGKP